MLVTCSGKHYLVNEKLEIVHYIYGKEYSEYMFNGSWVMLGVIRNMLVGYSKELENPISLISETSKFNWKKHKYLVAANEDNSTVLWKYGIEAFYRI